MDADLTDLIGRMKEEEAAEAGWATWHWQFLVEVCKRESWEGTYTAVLIQKVVTAAHHANRALDLRAALALLSRSCEECKHRVDDVIGGAPCCGKTETECKGEVSRMLVYTSCGEFGNGCHAWEPKD